MTIPELAARSNLSEKYVKSRIGTVPGVEAIDGSYIIPEGTRFPFDISRYKKFTFGNCRYIIVKATDEKRYIDADMLRLSQGEFAALIKELVETNYIRAIQTENTLGANGYISTAKYDEIKQQRREQIIRIITEAVNAVSTAVPVVCAAVT